MNDLSRIPAAQRLALCNIARYECADFGFIVATATAVALQRRGLAIEAERRRYARGTGVCLRLTEAGFAMHKELTE